MHLWYAVVILEYGFNSPSQHLVPSTVACENPASHRSVDESGSNTINASCSVWNILGEHRPHAFSQIAFCPGAGK